MKDSLYFNTQEFHDDLEDLCKRLNEQTAEAIKEIRRIHKKAQEQRNEKLNLHASDHLKKVFGMIGKKEISNRLLTSVLMEDSNMTIEEAQKLIHFSMRNAVIYESRPNRFALV